MPLALTGNHLVTANAWWGPAGIVDGNTRLELCSAAGEAEAVLPAAGDAASAAAGHAAGHAAATPPATPPAATPPPPAGAVAGVQASSPASARASFASSCASRTARITIVGRQMRSVTLFVNGHRIRTVRVAPGTRTLHVRVPIARGRAQIVSARVTFRNGARARTLTNHAVRCAAAQVAAAVHRLTDAPDESSLSWWPAASAAGHRLFSGRWRAGAAAHDELRRDREPSPPESIDSSITSSSSCRPRRPISLKSWRTVVSGGVKYSASGMSSKPTTLTSPGTVAAASCRARSTPSAIWSLATKTAVTSGSSASRRPSS